MKNFTENNALFFTMKKTVTVLLVLFTFLMAKAQDKEENDKVKIGLVLSGGGAKGMAHIGAIKVIEEAGVKIDYIGGTSMGAIVGALYASGYSATQLDSIFRNTDFTSLINDEIPRGAKTFYEKEDSERYALKLPFDNFKIAIPSGYSGGQNIYNEMVKYLYHVKDINEFNKLPIPFVCVATDVETGEEIKLDHGYLPKAIMASGTLPSLFEPATVEGKVLIDGGVVNNYPVEEVRKMGADIIIGVDVQHGLKDREGLGSATEILLQINNFRAAEYMKEKSELTDVYIKPDMEKYTVMDFDLDNEIITSGETAAREKWNDLIKIGTTQDGTDPSFEKIAPVDSLSVSRLIIKGDNTSFSRGYVKGKLRFKLGEKIAFEKLQRGINNLVATGNFKTIRYELLSNEVGEDLVLNLNETKSRTFIKFRVGMRR